MRIKYLILLGLITTMVACGEHQPSVPVGLQTDVAATEADVMDFDDYADNLFDSIVRLKATSHFQGKALVLFDTIYTSVVGDLDPIAVIKIIKHGDFEIIDMKEREYHALFLKRKDRYIYREIVPEDLEKQSILIDVIHSDSALIADYYHNDKLLEIINP